MYRNLGAPSEVAFRTVPGTAAAVDTNGWGDFTNTTGTLTFPNGLFTNFISVPLRDNHSSQTNQRSFHVELLAAGSTTVLHRAEVRILDDDPPPSTCSFTNRQEPGRTLALP